VRGVFQQPYRAEDKLPALRVAMGADQLVEPYAQSLADSELDVSIFSHALDSATNIETLLSRIRKEVTVALMANGQTLGLAFVHSITELGATKPLLTGELAKRAGQQELQFRVLYRRSVTDPSA
jgi:hypothetical protein